MLEGSHILEEGHDITVVAYGCRVQLATRLGEIGKKEGFSAEVINLRSLRPLDVGTLSKSVKNRQDSSKSVETLAKRIVAEIASTAFFI